MKWVTLLLFLGVLIQINAQKDSTKNKISIELSPISIVWNNGFNIAHGINGKANVFKKLFFEFNSDIVVFRKFDARNAKFPSNIKFPKYFQGDFRVGYKHNFKSNFGTTRNGINFTFGYNSLSFGTSSNSVWRLDSTLNGIQSITGFSNGSLILGVEYNENNYFGPHPIFIEKYLGLNLIYCTSQFINVSTISNENVTNDFVKSPFGLKKIGAKIYFKYKFPFNDKIGIYTKAEVLWSQRIEYNPVYNTSNYEKEKLNPLFFGLSFGLYF